MTTELTYTKQVNASVLCSELNTALGQAVESVAVKGDQVTVYLRDEDTKSTDVDAVIAAHVYAPPVAEQRKELVGLAELLVTGIDFDALDARIDSSMTWQEAVKGLARGLYLLAVQGGLTDNTKQAERAAQELGQYFGLIEQPSKV